jgi:DNA-binding Lrp family transcriptional regulator
MAPMDDIDRQIVEALRADGRMSMRALADLIHISRASAYARVARLENDGVITGYAAVIDPVRAGYALSAYVYLDIAQRSWKSVRGQLLRMPDVDHVALVSGEHDILLRVRARDAVSLRDVVLTRLQDIPEVRSTQTVLIFEEVTPVQDPRPLGPNGQPRRRRPELAQARGVGRGLPRQSGLQRHELAGEFRDEVSQRLRGDRRPDDELAEARVGQRGDHVPGARPAVGDQRRRVGVRPPSPDGGGKRVGDTAERDRQAGPEVVLVDRAPRLVGRGIDRGDRAARFVRGEQRAEPAVGEPPHPAQPGWRRSAEPDVERLGRPRAD